MGISLTEALGQLRRELYAAQDEGADEQFQFEVEQAELSLEVEFRRDGNGKVKVEVGLPGTKAGGEVGGGLGSTRRQVLTLRLQVRDEAMGGERAKIRRATGGLDTPKDSSVKQAPEARALEAPESSEEGTTLRPWER